MKTCVIFSKADADMIKELLNNVLDNLKQLPDSYRKNECFRYICEALTMLESEE